MRDENNVTDLQATDDLKPILAILNEKDAQTVLALKTELADNWNKKQIFRTETEMRVSVLNDARHPTPASKYWQAVREMSAMFDALMVLSFDLRRNQIKRKKLEKELEKAIEEKDSFREEELIVDLDENIYVRATMEQVAHDRIRELELWSKIKNELNDGSFDSQNVDSHQAEALRLTLENRAKTLGPGASPAEVMNALGPLETIERLQQGSTGKLLDYKEASKKQIR